MTRPFQTWIALATCGAALAACVHTPPGTSVQVALAKRPELVKLPAPPAPIVPPAPSRGQIAAVEPPLPDSHKVEDIAEAFTLGGFCMEAGKDAEAIVAFEKAVELDPSFTEAWESLASLYEKTGQQPRAVAAMRKAKKVARQ